MNQGRYCSRAVLNQLIIMLILALFLPAAFAELVLTAPPRENVAEGQKLYAPLAAELTELLGEKVTYQQPKGWLYYQRDMRADKFDIVFDGPHFISWRVKQFSHVPVAKLPGKLGFVVITSIENEKYTGLVNLINVPVCVIAPPNLATLTVLAEYDNPVRQPKLITAKGGNAGVYQAFKQGKCKAAVLRDKYFYKKVSEQERADMKVLFTSAPVTNQGITVSSRVSEENRDRVAAALTKGSTGTASVLKRFSPGVEKFVLASKEDYDNHYELLTGVIFGWEITNPEYARAE